MLVAMVTIPLRGPIIDVEGIPARSFHDNCTIFSLQCKIQKWGHMVDNKPFHGGLLIYSPVLTFL